MVKLSLSEWLICYITINSYYSGCPSFSTRPSLIVLLFSQFWGHNCGTGRRAGSRAELRTDGGSVGQRPGASQTVGLSAHWHLHLHACHPVGFSHSLSFCNSHGTLMSFPASSCFALSILSLSTDVQISSLRKQWIGGIRVQMEKSHNNSLFRGNSKVKKLVYRGCEKKGNGRRGLVMKGRRPPGAEGKMTTAALHLNVKAEATKRLKWRFHMEKIPFILPFFCWLIEMTKKVPTLFYKFQLLASSDCTVKTNKSSFIYYKARCTLLYWLDNLLHASSI